MLSALPRAASSALFPGRSVAQRTAIFLALALTPFAAPAAACKLALALAIDISNSVDGDEFRLQTEGLAEALLDPVVRDALATGDTVLTVFLWSGRGAQYVIVPWRRIEGDAMVVAVSEEVRAIRRTYLQSNTALGDAVRFARELFDEVPECPRRTLDVSGDGMDNAGTRPWDQRDLAERASITVNALAIDVIGGIVTDYFRQALITRDGFVMTSRGHEGYAETLKRKLRRELAEAMM